MDFIFMLTRDDRTVPDCLEVFDVVADLGIPFVGFKDVGADTATLGELTRRIHASGARACMEVVSTTSQRIRESMFTARELGVDRVLGGQDAAYAAEILSPAGIDYYPFPGAPRGHPTELGGCEDAIARDCRAARDAGCAGVDLLAYRAVEADPVALAKAARRALGDGYLIVAGSIDSPQRMRTMADAGADAFTIGTAVFEETIFPGQAGPRAQCRAVLEACAA